MVASTTDYTTKSQLLQNKARQTLIISTCNRKYRLIIQVQNYKKFLK